MRTRLGMLLVTALVGCTSKTPANPPTPKACTEIGCMNGLLVRLGKSTPWPHGDYELVFDIDGTAVTCRGALPLPPCEQGPALTCDPPGRVQVSESGCALEPAAHGWSDLSFEGEPEQVKVTIRHGDAVLHTADIAATYQTLQPNGPGCEPTCRSASGSITVP